jgi:hypothetical protein
LRQQQPRRFQAFARLLQQISLLPASYGDTFTPHIQEKRTALVLELVF